MESKNNQDYNIDHIVDLLKSNNIHTKFPYSHGVKTKGKIKNLSLGRIFFNNQLPEDYPLIDEPVNDRKLQYIVKDISEKYPLEVATKTISTLVQNAFRIGTISPSTLSVDVFIPPESWIALKEKFQKEAHKYEPMEFVKKAQEITNILVQHMEEKGYRIHNILKGGAKGDPIEDWRTILVAKGYAVDIEGNVNGPIVNSISDGYNKQDYFHAAAEARRTFYYKASLTAIPGYLSRKLAMACSNITLDDIDCKSKKYYELLVTKEMANGINGRYMYDNGNLYLLDDELIKKNMNKVIQIRSPLYCRSKNDQICKICFGELATKLNTNRLGIMCAGTINLIVINAMMKLRHRTNQLDVQEVDFNKILDNSKINVRQLSEFINIQKNKITCKRPVKLIINLNDYMDGEILNTSTYYQLPGILNMSLSDKEYSVIQLPFDFVLKVHKNINIEENKNMITIEYNIPGETIIEQDVIVEDTDPNVLRKLFDGGFSYLKNPEILVEMIYKNLKSVDLCHIELIVQNMFRDVNNNELLGRHVGYKQSEILSQKKVAFTNSWVNNISFENIDNGIKNGLLSEKDIKYDPIENMVLEKFD